MKKKIVSIVLTALMLSLTACGTNSNDTVQNVSQGKLATEVVEQNVSETEDTKESKEALSSEGKTIREDASKESKADAEHLTNKKTESDDKEAKSEDKETVSNDKVEPTVEETTVNTDSDKTETATETPVSNETAPAQSQTLNVNVDGFGNFVLILDGNAHVASALDGFAEYNSPDFSYLSDAYKSSYDFYIVVPLEAQDANKSFTFEIKYPDNATYNFNTAIIQASSDTWYSQLTNFATSNGIISGTTTADGQDLVICFNVKF